MKKIAVVLRLLSAGTETMEGRVAFRWFRASLREGFPGFGRIDLGRILERFPPHRK